MHATTTTDDPASRAARARIQELDEETLAEQLRIVAIPAPTGSEAARGEHLARRFGEVGLANVQRDAVGNVIAALPGGRGAPVVVSAHLDTVFAADVPLAPVVEGSRARAPGITDNARGLAALLTLARVLVETGIPMRAPLVFAATVGEEGAGDLRGVKHLFLPGGRLEGAAAFISIDGSGLRRIVHRGVGSRRLRFELTGPGGHSWSDWGTPNAVHAAARAIAAAAAVELPARPRTTLTVARMGGGTSINSIPADAWFEVDIRSESPEQLRRAETECRDRVARAVAAENGARTRGSRRITVRPAVIGDRPAGETGDDSRLVRAAIRATRAVGAKPELAASSTDANLPMSLGIPAVTIGGGGESGGVHTVDEWFDNRGGAAGIERALLLLLEVAGPPRE